MNLSRRARNALFHFLESKGHQWGEGDPNPEIVARYSKEELLAAPNLGRRTLNEIREWLVFRTYGLILKDMSDESRSKKEAIAIAIREKHAVKFLVSRGYSVEPPSKKK